MIEKHHHHTYRDFDGEYTEYRVSSAVYVELTENYKIVNELVAPPDGLAFTDIISASKCKLSTVKNKW